MKTLSLRRLTGALLVAGLASTGLPGWSAPALGAIRPSSSGPSVLVVGDSMTARARPFLRHLRAKWTIDGVGGRKVDLLADRITAYLADNRPPAVVVIALGSNEVLTWSKDDYVAATELLPKRTSVVFVTVYRDPAIFGVERDETMRRYSRWMREIARERPKTGVVPWRMRVINKPYLLLDGVHATDPEGERVWTKMVIRGVNAVTS